MGRQNRWKKACALLLAVTLMFFMPVASSQTKAKVRLNKTKITMYVGKKVTLKVNGGSSKQKKRATWKTSNKKVATVSKKGVVKAKSKGSAKITVRVAGRKLICKVTVKNKPVVQNNRTSGASVATTKKSITTPSSTRQPLPTSTPNTGATKEPAQGGTEAPTATPTPKPKAGIIFSQNSGVYKDAFDLTIQGPEGSTVYYTTDGSEPLYDQETIDNSPREEGLPFVLTEENEEFKSSKVTTSYSGDDVTLTFGKQYSTICYKSPSGETDWTKYDRVVIDYTVDQIGNGGNTFGLQVAPIYADATSSWNGTNGSGDTTRVHETRVELAKGSGVAFIPLDSQYDHSSVGRFMLGVYNQSGFWGGKDEITIHTIRLLKPGEVYESSQKSSFPAKQPTKKYEGGIHVKDRDGEANVLCANANIPCLYLADQPFYPSVAGVPKATVIRAVAVDKNGKKSAVVTKVYYVNKDFKKLYPNASVLSIVTDPDNLLNETTGIMHSNNVMESGEEWERPADILYIDEDGSIPVDATVGIRIHGGYSRNWGQKSFRLYFRESYGQKNIKGYQIIPGAMDHDKTAPTTKYKKLIVRNGGNDYAQTKMQDVFTQSLVENRAFATQSARPCVVYLNGEYWGLYNLTERYSDDFLETEFGLKDKSNAVMVKNAEVDTDGEDDQDYYDEFKAMADWDMTDEKKLAAFKEKVDYQSFLDYFATEIYIANKDWPNNNIEIWRSKKNDGTKYGDTKWRYMLFDTEFGMNQYGNSEQTVGNAIEWAKGDKIFAAVMKNKQCQKDMADTIMEIARENFDAAKAKKKLNEMAAIYHPLMNQYRLRFGPDNDSFDSSIGRIETFLDERPEKMKSYIKKSFGITVQ